MHALIEFNTRDDAARAAETLNDDKDWRNGLRVRLLVRNVHKKKKQQKQQQQRLEDEHAEEDDANGGGGGGGEGGGEGGGVDGDGAASKKNKKKGKWGRQGKKDYSQWASAAAFQANKAFPEAGDGGGDGEGGGGEGGGGVGGGWGGRGGGDGRGANGGGGGGDGGGGDMVKHSVMSLEHPPHSRRRQMYLESSSLTHRPR